MSQRKSSTVKNADLSKIKMRGNLILSKLNPPPNDEDAPLKKLTLPEHVRADYQKENFAEYVTKLKVLSVGPEVSKDITVGTIVQIPASRLEYLEPIEINGEVFHYFPDTYNNCPIIRLD